jgi:hypothetical protein
MQTTSHLLMIRPVHFDFNKQTAVNNSFQIASTDRYISGKALEEFDRFVTTLTAHGIDVTVVEDTSEPNTPDSIFPNNWVSFHDNGTVCLYPMFAINRRTERKPHVIRKIREKFLVNKIIDLTHYESEDLFLEGTGSMVLDRENHIVYACLSPRTDKKIALDFCDRFHYKPVVFHGVDEQKRPIYHTNVMMCVADKYVSICLETITDPTEKENLIGRIVNSGKEIIELSFDQINHFAGNMLQVENSNGEKFLVLSSQAYRSLDSAQLTRLGSFNSFLHSDLDTIETVGGGSARCMMAEVFLPLKGDLI